ncbi:MAG TPA: carboxynorspermidine decarboxylase [Spirochaetia bacterium]|nr:carboxynorspermidine decarboxylase [Spirochaetia bacterium]
MDIDGFSKTGLRNLKTPCFIISEQALKRNLEILAAVQKDAGCRILLAQKAFSYYPLYKEIKKHLYGVCASGLNEARLGHEEFGREVHVHAPAFSDEDFTQILKYATHIVFNSVSQLQRFRPAALKKKIKIGLRLNPETSVAGEKFGIYDPCCPASRLGITAGNLIGNLTGISGLHFHALCEQGVDPLIKVLNAFEKKFSHIIQNISWINFGGGHHITSDNYDRKTLSGLIKAFKKKYPGIREVYLEPGEAVVMNTAVMAISVLDIIKNGRRRIAVTDTSVEAHILDVLLTRHEKIPYIPEIIGAGRPGKFKYNYLLGGISCAAGDIIGEYSFPEPLYCGQKLILNDMAYYTMVKFTMFNGVNLPRIYHLGSNGKCKTVWNPGYAEYKKNLF